ncbi:phage tail protein [Pantoea coffeiphila]|uniref:phage tail protein n=1 Tax=Pantoea coffeiphila TaxID=1465635 RepID=UPI00195FC25C|nr:phage tail protein [Pantoea coffeiphila]MBM7341686.1 hypothetical protein [Pantoea coffeiphila]
METRKYFATLTLAGVAALAQAALSGETVGFTEMAVGDGGGTLPTPTPEQVGLINECYRAQLNRLVIADQGNNIIRAEMIIPPQAGGFWLRETALFDENGICLAVANMAPTYKPLLSEGSGRMQAVNIWIAVSSTENVELKADPSVILASVDEVNRAKNEVKDYTDDEISALDASLKTLISEAVSEAITNAKRDFWEEENPKGTVRFFAQKVDPNELYPWSTWVYTGENKSIRVGKADGTNVGQTGGSDTVTIKRENLPAETLDVSGKAASVELNDVETTGAGGAEFNVYRFGQEGRENSIAPFSLDDVDMGDIPVPVEIQPHKHTISLTVPERDVSGKTEALGQGKTISIVEEHTLFMCWARTA